MKAFDENNAYKPNSPYSASKASSDHLVRSYNRTYNFPSITINCSNNYGLINSLKNSYLYVLIMQSQIKLSQYMAMVCKYEIGFMLKIIVVQSEKFLKRKNRICL